MLVLEPVSMPGGCVIDGLLEDLDGLIEGIEIACFLVQGLQRYSKVRPARLVVDMPTGSFRGCSTVELDGFP